MTGGVVYDEDYATGGPLDEGASLLVRSPQATLNHSQHTGLLLLCCEVPVS